MDVNTNLWNFLVLALYKTIIASIGYYNWSTMSYKIILLFYLRMFLITCDYFGSKIIRRSEKDETRFRPGLNPDTNDMRSTALSVRLWINVFVTICVNFLFLYR